MRRDLDFRIPREEPLPDLDASITRAQDLLLTHQFPEGYWWYTLEANETIGAEYIFLTHFLGCGDPQVNRGLCERMLQEQRSNGSWAIFYGGPGDLSTTLECYWALKYCGYDIHSEPLRKAREFILWQGGPTKARVFTKIHLAMFGLAPWDACPSMPLWLIHAPSWAPINIYEFSSWARACIVPLLVVLNQKPVVPMELDLAELYPETPEKRHWNYVQNTSSFSLENFFLQADTALKWLEKVPNIPWLRSKGFKACEKYIREHLEKTEDIFPALAYGALALKTLGYPSDDPIIQKALRALKSFQQPGESSLPHIPRTEDPQAPSSVIHQQCCISPVWDTPWATMALLDSGLEKNHPALTRAMDWLLEKQILNTRGDWAVKNSEAQPGGWAFEFENDYFPDVDDTIEVLTVLHHLGLNDPRRQVAFDRGIAWLWSMQSKNGGWGAFDKDNTLDWVNRIPFSDHGACLDPPTPDITARMLEFLALIGHDAEDPRVQQAIQFIYQSQLESGPWEGRWGVNYLYGTWCVLQGLTAIGQRPDHPALQKALRWLRVHQNPDGGWGESCEGYRSQRFTPLKHSVPSQTAWALMGMIALGQAESSEVKWGIRFLLNRQNGHGCWDEREYTGTGFPGHFYIRYHGYRHYFPLLALGKYRQALGKQTKPEESLIENFRSA